MKNCAECFNMRGKMPEKNGLIDYQNHAVSCQKGYFKFSSPPEKNRTFKHFIFARVNKGRHYDLWKLAETCVDYNLDKSFDFLKEANHVRNYK